MEKKLDNSFDLGESQDYEISILMKEESNDWLKNFLKKHKASILKEEPIYKIRLAYPVKKQAQAFLSSIFFRIEKLSLDKLINDLKLVSESLRYTITGVESKKGSASGIKVQKIRKPVREDEQVIKKPVKAYKTGLTNEAIQETIEEILK